MTHEPITVHEMDAVDIARRNMRELDEWTLPVIDTKGVLSGMVHIMDIVDVMERQVKPKRITGKEKKRPQVRIRDIMSSTVASIGTGAKLGTVVKTMLRFDATSVVITEREVPTGLVTLWDLLEILASFKKREGVHVQITGLDSEDPSIFDGMHYQIRKSVKRISRYISPKVVNVHGIEHCKEGETVRYTLSVKLVTPRKQFAVRDEAYNLMLLLDELLERIERRVKKDREMARSRDKLRR
jgi:CBS domain-containing protein/ribosome-associated translation inhibitor RaiA